MTNSRPERTSGGPVRRAAVRVGSVGSLAPAQVREVLALVEAVTTADGVAPLSEHTLLHLPGGGTGTGHHLLARRGAEGSATLVGYAHVEAAPDAASAPAGWSGELAVLPSARGQGVGDALVEGLLAQVSRLAAPDPATAPVLRLWAHGRHPAAAHLASRHGFHQARVLLQMRRSLLEPLPEPVLPPGVALRTFQVGRDERAWTELNNRAFASHPDQGGWTLAEVGLREREPWFDAAGFFLAGRGDRLVGFHWTKVHGVPGGAGGPGHEALGEVYVVGVDPDETGHGLGRALTLVGLHHLRGRGLEVAMLYADESNAPAVRLYERLGFTVHDVDVSYARP